MDLRIWGFLSPERRQQILQSERDHAVARLDRHLKSHKPEVWNEDTVKFQSHMVIDGTTYNPPQLFAVEPFVPKGSDIPAKCRVTCPNKKYLYVHQILKRGHTLRLFQNKRRGEVQFTTDVVIPVLAETNGHGGFEPWMSVTPMEVLTMRKGIMLAKDTVVIGGLGMGYLLRKVCEKKSVKRVIVVESAQWILDMFRPRLMHLYPQIAEKVTDWICGDIYDHVGKYGEDARHLLDIWQSYGSCDHKFEKLKRSKTVKYLWGWGDVQY